MKIIMQVKNIALFQNITDKPKNDFDLANSNYSNFYIIYDYRDQYQLGHISTL